MLNKLPLPLRQAIAIAAGVLVIGFLLVFTLAPIFTPDPHDLPVIEVPAPSAATSDTAEGAF